MGFKYGQMDLDTMDSGEIIWQMDTEDLFTLKETSMKESGPKIRLMAMESILILMEADMKVSGSKTNNMVTV